jgi:hypothetical protein
MTIRSLLRAVEKSSIRPVGRILRRGWERLRGGRTSRMARLERRVEELESLVRELTGLAYLRLADEEAADDDRSAA